MPPEFSRREAPATRVPARPAPGTHILILGQSNTAGTQLANADRPWPRLLEAALPALAGSPVTITMRPFYAHAPGADVYLERELARHEPDIILMTLTPFAFLTPVVGPGVRRRFGDRAGDAYQWLESHFDAATRHRGRGALRANRVARRIMHLALGAAPVSSYEDVLAGTANALQRLAREEDVQVVAFQGFVQSAKGRGKGARRRASLLARFLTETRDVAERLRILYLCTQGSVEASGEALFLPDDTHVTAAGHRAVAEVILAAFRDGRLQLPPSAI
jgi:lysophospholipase L1-like esterase